MVEDEVIAEQMERLLTLFYYKSRKLLPKIRTQRADIEFTVDDGCGVNLTVARRPIALHARSRSGAIAPVTLCSPI